MSAADPQPTWRDVLWSLGGNDRFNDCSVVAAFANWRNLLAAIYHRDLEPVSEVECLTEYRRLTGFDQFHPLDDRGVFLDTVLRDMVVNGVFGDPLWTPPGFHAVEAEQIPAALKLYHGLPCWGMLRLDADGEPVFDDQPSDKPHSTLIVDYVDNRLALITWGTVIWVPWEWWAVNGKQAFAVEVPEAILVG